jgi:AraC-like DNA-binding protein
MRYLHRLIFMTLMWLCCLQLSAKTQASTNDVELEAMLCSCSKLCEKYDYKALSVSSARFLETAKNKNNKKYEAYAYFLNGVAKLFTGRANRCMSDLNKAREMAEEEGNDSLVSLALNSMGLYESSSNLNMYIAQRYYLKSLEYAKRCNFIRQEASIYGNLSELALFQNDTTGLKYAIKCRDFGLRYHYSHNILYGTYCMSALYHLMHKNELALHYIKETILLYNKYGYKNLVDAYTLYASILIDMNHNDEAMGYLNLALSNANINKANVRPETYYQYARIYMKKRDFLKSNEWCMKALQTARNSSEHTSEVRLYELLADNFHSMGNYEVAYSYLMKAKIASDTIHTTDKEHLKHEREMVYQMAKKEQEVALKKQELRDQLLFIIILSAAVIILTVLLVIIIRNYRHRNRLYKSIVQQNSKAVEKEKEMRQKINSLTEELSSHDSQSSKINSGKSQDIYEKLCFMMEHDRLYADNQLTRERIAELLDTNRTYITQIMKDHSWQNLSQFVNSYRINEAVRLLSDKSKTECTMKEICTDIGFTSMSAFFRMFKTVIGMSPASYRKYMQDIDDNK